MRLRIAGGKASMHSCNLPIRRAPVRPGSQEGLAMKSLRLVEAMVCGWLALGCAVGSASAQTAAQNPPASAGPVEPALLEDLAMANHILASHGVLDAYGHVSVRHPANPDRFLMSRSLAPALVTTG